MFGYNTGLNNPLQQNIIKNNPMIGPMVVNPMIKEPLTMNSMMNKPMINNNGIIYNPMGNTTTMNYIPINPLMNAPIINKYKGINVNASNGGNIPAKMKMDANYPGYLNIIFENIGSGKVNMQVSPNDSVGTVVNNYKKRSNMQENDIKFIYNGSQLNYSLSVADSGLMDGSIVTVLSLRNVCGA